MSDIRIQEAHMTNIEFMEKALPIAPLKIIALKSCEPLAKKVDNYIVSFRKESLHDFLDPATDLRHLLTE